jgi:hypothetical protein
MCIHKKERITSTPARRPRSMSMVDGRLATTAAGRLATKAAGRLASFDLDTLDIHRYDVFAVCSEAFWQHKRELVSSFFEHLRHVQGKGFLAAPSASVCRGALAELGITCVVSHSYRYDGALSKERWRVLLNAVRRGHRLAYAGLDFRFLQPVRTLLHAARGASVDVEVDVAFETTFDSDTGSPCGAGIWTRQRSLQRACHVLQRPVLTFALTPLRSHVLDSTPDLAIAYPTARAAAFLERLVEMLLRRSLDGLPLYMRVPTLLRFNLMGPAEQATPTHRTARDYSVPSRVAPSLALSPGLSPSPLRSHLSALSSHLSALSSQLSAPASRLSPLASSPPGPLPGRASLLLVQHHRRRAQVCAPHLTSPHLASPHLTSPRIRLAFASHSPRIRLASPHIDST